MNIQRTIIQTIAISYQKCTSGFFKMPSTSTQMKWAKALYFPQICLVGPSLLQGSQGMLLALVVPCAHLRRTLPCFKSPRCSVPTCLPEWHQLGHSLLNSVMALGFPLVELQKLNLLTLELLFSYFTVYLPQIVPLPQPGAAHCPLTKLHIGHFLHSNGQSFLGSQHVLFLYSLCLVRSPLSYLLQQKSNKRFFPLNYLPHGLKNFYHIFIPFCLNFVLDQFK